MLIIFSCSSKIYYLYLYFWSLEMKYLCKCFSAKTRRFSPVAVRLIKHRPVLRASFGARTGIGRFVKRFLKVPGACQTSYDARPGTVEIVRYKFFNKTSSDVCKRRPDAVRAPYGADQCHSILVDPTKRRTGAVEF